MDERDVELVAFEVAYLERSGWRLYAGRWRHPETQVEHERSTAVGVQRIRDHEAAQRKSVARLPLTAPPAPSDDVPTKPSRVPLRER